MAKHGKDYFGWNRVLSIILAIISCYSLHFGLCNKNC